MMRRASNIGLNKTPSRIAAAFFALCLLFARPLPVYAEKSPEVRVLLTALQLSDQLNVGVYGEYFLNGQLSFQRGSTLNIQLKNQSLNVYYEGMVYHPGKSILLKRHALSKPGGENGLRLQNGLNLYTGDLSVRVHDDGSLRAILILPVEEYLLGVVPYEMADDFPIEALKAQAVAARTYTIRNMKPQEDYDLVDSTDDQVYRGLDKGKINAIRAVAETGGAILTYQGDPAHCFYTASNGGVTESALNAWGRESIPYLQIKQDPYDLENPLSEVREARIPKEVIGKAADSMPPQLLDQWMSALRIRLEPLGYGTDPEHISINGINGITPHTAKFGGDEGVMKYLRFDLSVSGRKKLPVSSDREVSLFQATVQPLEENDTAWSPMMPLPQTQSVDVPIFPDIEEIFLLSINRSENEIVRVREEPDRFVLTFTRYGHGVGMSQRGAEWMAKTYHWDFQQILRFYYPGTEIQTIGTELVFPEKGQEEFLTTPGPIPTPTPRPTLMPQSSMPKDNERVVIVSGVPVNSSLNLRAQPNLSSEVIMRLYFGQELLVIETLPDGWLQVKTDVTEGFIREEFVSEKKDH